MMDKKLKIAYFGTPEIAVPPLEALISDDNVEVLFVGVFPDKKIGRKQVLSPCPVKAKAQVLGLPIIEIVNKADLIPCFKKEDFDLAIVVAFGMIFPKALFEMGKDIMNVHFSLLPQYRGASPVQSAILNGDKISGITFQRMVYELDAGNIMWQQSYDIEDQSTSALWSFFADETAKVLPSFLKDYQANKLKVIQQDKSKATFCGKFTKKDGLIDWHEDDPELIYRKYRAFDVWPGIYMTTKHGNLKLKNLTFKNKVLQISQAQLPGKKAMDFKAILNGYPDILDK